MKKRILSLSLITLVTGGFLTSCGGDVKFEDGVIIKIGDTSYTIEEAYRELNGYQMSSSDTDYTITQEGAQNYYNLLKNIMIQLAVPTTTAITRYIDERIDNEYYQAAKDNASANGTSESEERENILESNNVDSVEELRSKFLLERKTTRNTNSYYSDSNYETLTPEYIEKKSPYHVRHILVNVDAASSDITNATISESNAKHLYNVITRLSSAESFGQVAQTASDDGSASTYGDVGIMDIDTSFVSEFKYALYGYDTYFNASSDKALAKERLAIPSNAQNTIGTSNFGIPLSQVLLLDKYADKTTDDKHLSVEYATERNYPRNIIFSQYLNNHGSSYIYLDKEISAIQEQFGITIDENKFKAVSGISTTLKQAVENSETHKTQYQTIDGSQRVLCDETGRPIIVTRAGTGTSDSGYQGIHFIIAQRSPFVDITSTVDGKEVNNIANYYSLDIPSVTSTTEDTSEPTYINFVKTDDRQVYTERADAIRNELRSIDDNMEYRIYESNLAAAKANSSLNIQINSKVQTIVDRYIANSRATAKANSDLAYATSWESYLELLELQQDLISRVLPTSCIDSFLAGNIQRGGVCDVDY